MTTTRTELHVRRVVVALDALCENTGALATGVRLAQRWRCELQGVFVVDADLVHLGDLPGVRQVGLAASDCGLLDPAGLSQALAGLEARARRALAEVARSTGIATSFAVARGSPAAEAAGLSERDLLVVESATRPFLGGVQVESRWRRHAAAARQPVLLLRGRSATGGPVVCLHDGGPAGERALALAARLSADSGGALEVVLGPDAAPAIEAELSEAHGGARVRRLAADGDRDWSRAVAEAAPALLVVPAGAPPARWSGSAADLLLVP